MKIKTKTAKDIKGFSIKYKANIICIRVLEKYLFVKDKCMNAFFPLWAL